MSSKKYAVVSNDHAEIISEHKSLELANKALNRIDTTKYSISRGDFEPWQTHWMHSWDDAASQGYNYSVWSMEHLDEFVRRG